MDQVKKELEELGNLSLSSEARSLLVIAKAINNLAEAMRENNVAIEAVADAISDK